MHIETMSSACNWAWEIVLKEKLFEAGGQISREWDCSMDRKNELPCLLVFPYQLVKYTKWAKRLILPRVHSPDLHLSSKTNVYQIVLLGFLLSYFTTIHFNH